MSLIPCYVIENVHDGMFIHPRAFFEAKRCINRALYAEPEEGDFLIDVAPSDVHRGALLLHHNTTYSVHHIALRPGTRSTTHTMALVLLKLKKE